MKNNMKFTAKELKEKLWDTLIALEKKEIDARTANSIISAAREIINVVRTEIAIVQISGSKPTEKFLGHDE